MGGGPHHMNAHKGMKRVARNERTQTQGSSPSATSSSSNATSTATPTSKDDAPHSASSKWWWPFPLWHDHSGDGTYYEPGLGSCGKTNSGSDMIVAISHSMYDKKANSDNPNTSPYCGRRIKASYEGKSVVVTVVDRCTGCQFSDLDFSPAAFKKLASMDKGRLKQVKWSFMDD
ncbi:Lytic transglycosylase [Malassezia caprae]|uniref:Lytic transglycosylase n=1 Tax=Malassezia caprae TaxID=1381934 RepID=A0AAF0IZX7_9BASI|nr:Lytic transglycosylase [Malassezia caprae]